ncbi:hypothetical protein AB0R07_36835, partial [Streptomyces rochei]
MSSPSPARSRLSISVAGCPSADDGESAAVPALPGPGASVTELWRNADRTLPPAGGGLGNPLIILREGGPRGGR